MVEETVVCLCITSKATGYHGIPCEMCFDNQQREYERTGSFMSAAITHAKDCITPGCVDGKIQVEDGV